MDRQDLLTIEQTAIRVGRSIRTVRRWVAEGKIKFYRDGHPRGKLLFDPLVIEAKNIAIRSLYPS